MQIGGTVFAVTRGCSGIGRKVVLGPVAKGARVAAIDLSEEGLAETVRLGGDGAERISTHAVTITDRTAISMLPAAIIERHGQVDGLLNTIKPFVAELVKRPEATLVSISSMGAYPPVPGQSV